MSFVWNQPLKGNFKKVLFVYSTVGEMHLIPHVKGYFNEMGFKNVNFDWIHAFNSIYTVEHDDFSHMDKMSRYLYFSVMKIVNNFEENKPLLTDVIYNRCMSYAEDRAARISKEYDLYCFSVYYSYLPAQLIWILSILRNNPNAHILVGGPEIRLNDNIRNLFNRLGVSTSAGDVESSIFKALTEDKKLDYTSYIDISKLTYKSVPDYTEEEIKRLPYIAFSTSKGCVNNCHFCSASGHSKFRSMNLNTVLDWVKYYNDVHAKMLYFWDCSLNSVVDDFKNFMWKLSQLNNNKMKIGFYYDFYNSINDDELIDYIEMSNVRDMFAGLDGIHPETKKLMNTSRKKMDFDKVIDVLDKLDKKTTGVKHFCFIYGFPGQTTQSVRDYFDIFNRIMSLNNYVLEYFPFYIVNKSYVHMNPEKFDVTFKYTLPEYKEHFKYYTDIFANIFTIWDFPNKNEIQAEQRAIIEDNDRYDSFNIQFYQFN